MTRRICETHATDIKVDIDGLVITDAPAEFDIEAEIVWLEPYSWGGSRGRDIEPRAELLNLTIGAGLKLSRYQVLDMIGAEALDKLEENVAEEWRCAALWDGVAA